MAVHSAPGVSNASRHIPRIWRKVDGGLRLIHPTTVTNGGGEETESSRKSCRKKSLIRLTREQHMTENFFRLAPSDQTYWLSFEFVQN